MQNHLRNVAVLALILAGSSCSKPSSGGDSEDKKPTKTTDEKVDPKPIPALVDVLVEDFEFGSVGWAITSDGAVKAEVKDTSGAPIKEGFTGDLKVGEGDAPTAVTLEPIQGSAIYGATLPAFDADLTPINYTFKLSGKSYVGTLHVPAGGTAVVVKAAAATPKVVVAAGTKGPHGGIVQVVGDDRLEIVSDVETGEVRVFVLDVGLKPIVVGERKVTIGVVADHPEVVMLAPEPGGLYFTARWGIEVDPLRITLGVHVGARYDVAIVGFRPGVRLVVGAKAPVVAVRVKTGWGPPARVFVKGKWVSWDGGNGNGKGKGKDKDDDDHHAGKGGSVGGAIEVKGGGKPEGNEGKGSGGKGNEGKGGGNEGKGGGNEGKGGGGGGKKGKH